MDNYERWREFILKTLKKKTGLMIVGEASSGSEAVRKTRELEPDLVLLDIGLPILNGIEAAKRIREVSPTSRILFISEDRSPGLVEASLSIPASGYVLKSDARSELLPAVEAVLQGQQFVSARLSERGSAASDIEGHKEQGGVED